MREHLYSKNGNPVKGVHSSYFTWSLSGTWQGALKSEIDTLLDDGIIEESESVWCSPCVPVVKPDGQIRLCMETHPGHPTDVTGHYTDVTGHNPLWMIS